MNGQTDSMANNKKDFVWITMSGFSDSVLSLLKDDNLIDRCIAKAQVGVLVLDGDVQSDFDHARCVGEQKLVGF